MTAGRGLWLTAALAALLALSVAVWHHRNPTRQVVRRFASLATLIDKDAAESPIQAAIRSQQLQGYFTNPAELQTPVYGLAGALTPTDIASQTMSARAFFLTLSLRFQDLHVTHPSRGIAEATVTARIEGQTSTGDAVEEIREMQCVLHRESGTWRFASCKLVDVLKK
ncbi:MAG: hypothetical protein K8T26_13845 [Lentisphaerae bacterium]|nr:hypothetical protein [Lentisphaerota bacterium]